MFHTSVTLVFRLRQIQGRGLDRTTQGVVKHLLHVSEEVRLILFQSQEIIGLQFDQPASDFTLGAHGIDGDDTSLHFQQ